MFKELPASAVGLVSNNRTNNSHWGKPQVVDALLKIGKVWAESHSTPISVGHISRKDGNHFPPHKTHRNGDDVDMRPMRKDGANQPIEWTQQAYDQKLTREMIETIHANAPITSILFNDPVLIAEKLCIAYPNHSNHLHVNFGVFVSRSTLRRGDRGTAVADLQRRLGVEADGVFGKVTELAVREFQAHHNLEVDGIAGKATNALLWPQ